MVAFNKFVLLVFVLVIVLIPNHSKAEQDNSGQTKVWLERTGINSFHHQLDILFSPVFNDKIAALAVSGGPSGPRPSNGNACLKIDGQGSVEGRWRINPLQMPAPVFPYRPQILKGSQFRWTAGTGFQLSLPGGFSLWQRTLVGSERKFDPVARTKDYRQMDASIEIPLATINFHRNNFHLWQF